MGPIGSGQPQIGFKFVQPYNVFNKPKLTKFEPNFGLGWAPRIQIRVELGRTNFSSTLHRKARKNKNSKKFFQPIVYWLLLLMSDFQTRSPIWPAIWNKRLLCCAVVGLLTKKALNYDCLFATTYGKKYFAVQWQIKSFMQWLKIRPVMAAHQDF